MLFGVLIVCVVFNLFVYGFVMLCGSMIVVLCYCVGFMCGNFGVFFSKWYVSWVVIIIMVVVLLYCVNVIVCCVSGLCICSGMYVLFVNVVG